MGINPHASARFNHLIKCLSIRSGSFCDDSLRSTCCRGIKHLHFYHATKLRGEPFDDNRIRNIWRGIIKPVRALNAKRRGLKIGFRSRMNGC